MKQHELIERITLDLKASGIEISKAQVEAVLFHQAEVISEALASGDEVVLPRLAKLKRTTRKARRINHPISGERIELPTHNYVQIRPLKGLKDAINTPMEAKHFPEEWGPSDDRKLSCSCGHPDPGHQDVSGESQ